MNIEKINELIKHWKSKYRLLQDWSIIYNEEKGELETSIYPSLKTAYIGKWLPICKNEALDINTYIKHEMLHIVISMMKRDENGYFDYEEILVQDLCKLINNSIFSF